MKQRRQPSAQRRQQSSILENRIASLERPWRPLWAAFGANVVCFALAYLLFSAQFNTRDDIGMTLLAAGKIIALEPTEYLIFINVLLGHVFKALYGIMPGIPWYALFLVGSLFASHVALLYVALRRTSEKGVNLGVLGLYVVYFGVFASYMLLSLQFTMAASMAGFGGAALLLLRARGGEVRQTSASEERPGWKTLLSSGLGAREWCGVALIATSFLLRAESCALALLCSSPIAIAGFFRSDERKALLRSLPAWGLVAVVCAGAYGYNAYRYNHWGKFNYLEFNKLCGEFVDFKLVKRTTLVNEDFVTALASVNWAPGDYEMLINWFFMDEERFSIDKLTRFASEVRRRGETLKSDADPALRERWQQRRDELDATLWRRQAQTLRSETAWNAGALFLLSAAVALAFGRAEAVRVLLVVVVLFAAILYVEYLTLLRDTPERVTYPLFAFFALLPLLIAPRGSVLAAKQRPSLRLAFAALGAALALWAFFGAWTRNGELSDKARSDAQDFESVFGRHSPEERNMYVIWAEGFPLGGISPFSSPSRFGSFHALWLAWNQRTPASAALLERYGVRNVYTEIVENPRLFFLMSLNQLKNPLLMYGSRFNQYLRDHFGKTLNAEQSEYKFLTPQDDSEQNWHRTYVRAKFAYSAQSSAPPAPILPDTTRRER